jgi:putative heme iron utilization protein
MADSSQVTAYARKVFTEEQSMANTPENNVLEFLSSCKTLVMATVDKNGAPNASYAPFVQRTPWLYVYTSARSKHTKNMAETTKASVMFIEDEARTRNFFAPERFTSQCDAEVARPRPCTLISTALGNKLSVPARFQITC